MGVISPPVITVSSHHAWLFRPGIQSATRTIHCPVPGFSFFLGWIRSSAVRLKAQIGLLDVIERHGTGQALLIPPNREVLTMILVSQNLTLATHSIERGTTGSGSCYRPTSMIKRACIEGRRAYSGNPSIPGSAFDAYSLPGYKGYCSSCSY